MEYEVLWGDGPLGLTLRPDLGEDMPPVVGRITRLDSAAALAKVAVGDMLVSINGIDTARQGYDHVVDLLQKIQRPATLRFRVPRPVSGANSAVLGVPRVPSMSRDPSMRHQRAHRDTRGSTASTSSVSSTGSAGGLPMAPPRKNEQYTVVWTEGPLGMILRPDDDDVHVPCIRKITGKGAGTGMERAAVGDVLVAVNGQETKSLGFRSTISLLKTIRKPAVLKFKRMHRRVSRRRSSREDEATNGHGGHPTSNSISGGMPPPMPSGGSVSAPKEYGAYDIVWREGDLGLKLKPGDRDVPVLSKLTGKGTASGLQNANVGDELVSVNGVLVEGQAYHDTLRMLKHSVKPAVLRFRPGRDRRASGMSITSISSTRSAPSTNREHLRARSGHVPIYDTGRTPPPSNGLQRSTSSKLSRSPSGERKKKKRIPLDLAKELVAASQGIELESAMFAGLPILAIQEGTNEAHLLRVEAKMCITAKKDQTRNGLTPKEALLRAEEEARVLQEALERVKNQAKAYETALEHQKKEQLIKAATQNKSGEVVKKHNILLDELAGAIAGLKRDSYSDVDVVPMQLGNEEEMQGLMDDLQSVMNIPVVVPSTKFCAECGASEKDSKLDLDDDGQYYCTDCWENFLSAPGANSVPASEPEVIPLSPPAAPVVVPVVAEKKPEPTYSPPQPSLTKSESATSSLGRLSSMEREQEEKNARMEAEKKLMELKELRRTGSTRSLERQSSSMNAADRTRRERRGLEELAQALLEEEERARAEGNLTLAKKLSAQRARTMAEAKAEQQQKRNGLGHFSSMRDVLETSEPEFSRFYKNGSKNGSSGMSSSYDGPSSAIAEAAADDDVPPPVGLKRSVTLDSPYATSSKPLDVVAATTAVAAAASEPAVAVVANDYDDVDEDEEAEDQVDMSDGENDVLREVEEKNFALAKQLDEAHNVIQRARQSIMLSGDESAEEMSSALGLTEDQISLFKKLTSQADERMSTVDRLHPEEDDSDSEESDSDQSEKSGGGDEDDDEEDEGVWI